MLKVWLAVGERGFRAERGPGISVPAPCLASPILFQHPLPCSLEALGEQGSVSAPSSLLPPPPAGSVCCSESRVWILASSCFSPSLTFLPQSFL